jgi:putative tryptophan/tyrosine transport system substrate-binding protein
MQRRQLLAVLCGSASLPFDLVAQERKLPRLAIVNLILPVDRMSRSEAGSEGMRAFLDELARLGYVENETIKIERWSAGGNADGVAALAQEVVRSGPDVIHAISARLVQHLKSATSEIPIIAYTGDPVGFGFAASMSRPGGNVTGLSSDTGIDLVGKYLELLKELTPTASRLAFLAAKEVWEGPYARALFDAAEMRGIDYPGASRKPYNRGRVQAFLRGMRKRASACGAGRRDPRELRSPVVTSKASKGLPLGRDVPYS